MFSAKILVTSFALYVRRVSPTVFFYQIIFQRIKKRRMLRDPTNCSLKLKVDHILRHLGILENGLKWDYCFQHVFFIST